jgi:hypothetical protein
VDYILFIHINNLHSFRRFTIDITQFISSVAADNLLSQNRFTVTIQGGSSIGAGQSSTTASNLSVNINNLLSDVSTVATSVAGLLGLSSGPVVPDATSNIMINCASCTIPSLNIGTTSDKRYSLGSVFTYPDSRELMPITLSFYQANSNKERQYFSNWINKIYDTPTRRFNFLSNIAKNITINCYNKSDQLIYQCILTNAYPTHISELNRAYSEQDQIELMSVSIVYQEIQEKFIIPSIVNTVLSVL